MRKLSVFLSVLLGLFLYVGSTSTAASGIQISTSLPALNQLVTLSFPIPSDGASLHKMKVVSDDNSINIEQETSVAGGSFAYLNISFDEAKSVQLNTFLYRDQTLIDSNTFNLTIVGEKNSQTSATVSQIGVEGGKPVVEAFVVGGHSEGTYTLVLMNQKTEATYSQTLANDGKKYSFIPTIFSESGAYRYELQLNGKAVSSGVVQLGNTKKIPEVKANIKSGVLTIELREANDYISQDLHFQTGTYSGLLAVTNSTLTKTFPNVSGYGSALSVYTSTGLLVEVPISVVETPINNTPTPTDTGSPRPVSGESRLSISLDKSTYSSGEVMSIKVIVEEFSYAGRSMTLRVNADAASSIRTVTLDKSGYGEAVFGLTVPIASSEKVNATLYAINGDTVNAAVLSYTLAGKNNLPNGGQTSNSPAPSVQPTASAVVQQGTPDFNKTDGQFRSNIPSLEYAVLDLASVPSGSVTLSWSNALNLNLYTNKLIITNQTTKEQFEYVVRIPNGTSRANVSVEYGGSGVYSWVLTSGGRLVAQSPYSVPLGLENAGVISQDGLPVTKVVVNKPYDQPQPFSGRVGEVNASSIGEKVSGVVPIVSPGPIYADSVVDYGHSRKAWMLPILLGIFIACALTLGYFLYKRRMSVTDSRQPVTFNDGDDLEKYELSSENFEEVSPSNLKTSRDSV